MKVFVVLAVVALANARPEAGYSYGAPPRPISFGNDGYAGAHGGGGGGAIISNSGPFVATDSGAFGGHSYNDGHSVNLGSFSGGHGVGVGHGHGFTSGASSNGFSTGGSVGFGNGIGSGSTFSSGIASGAAFGNGIGSGASFGNGIGSGSAFGSGIASGSGFGQQIVQPQQQTVIQKHIYVHVPPPEPEEVHFNRQISAGIPQKHYKIIFIKAPSPPAPSAAAYAAAANSQEKTIVYVLVKKPDDIGDINIPAVVPTQPSKPEVYFIRYKTQKDHGGVNIGATGTGNNNIVLGTPIISDSSSGISSGNLGSSIITSGSAISSGSSNLGLSIGATGIGSGIGGGGIPATSYGPPNHHHGSAGPY